jgi:hypothetical protein
MLMPEAAMHKYHLLPRREDQVWFAREIRAVQTKAVAEAVYEFAECQFRTCVLAPDARHVGTAAFFGELVHTA